MPISTFPILWLTGNTGAGKTTLAHGLRDWLNSEQCTHPAAGKMVLLDGDEMRATISVDEGLSPADRRKHNLRVARLAGLLQTQGLLVVVAVIAPFETVRAELDEICSPNWIYVKRDGLEAADRPYEAPDSPVLMIDDDALSIEEARERLIEYVEKL